LTVTCALFQLLKRELGVDFSWDFRGNVAVTTTPTVILQHNPNRIAWCIWNLGETTVLVGFTQQVTTTSSIPIPPNGGSLQVLWREDLVLPAVEVWACTPTGSSMVSVLEIFGIIGGAK